MLVDYKKFRDSIMEQLSLLRELKDRHSGLTTNREEAPPSQRLKDLKQKHSMKFNETLSNYLKTRTDQFERAQSRDKTPKGREEVKEGETT